MGGTSQSKLLAESHPKGKAGEVGSSESPCRESVVMSIVKCGHSSEQCLEYQGEIPPDRRRQQPFSTQRFQR